MGNPRYILLHLILPVLLVLTGGQPCAVHAATFLGFEIAPLAGSYLVLRDVVVRAQPSAESRRIGNLDADERVEVVGQAANAAWLAIRREGKDFGFVPAANLMAMIDGRINEPLSGRVQPAEGPPCSYVIRFASKSEIPGMPFGTADYDVLWSCAAQGRTFDVYSYLFITEGPVAPPGQQYQISMDVPAIAVDYDRVLTTVLLYDRPGAVVRLDRVAAKALAAAKPEKERPAANVAQALRAAVEIAASSWNATVWKRLLDGEQPAAGEDGPMQDYQGPMEEDAPGEGD